MTDKYQKYPCNLQTAMMQYIDRYQLLKPGDKVLVAVSGGIDSTVMMHLLYAAGIDMVVAHCNFGLRGDESDGDEVFVKNEADKLGILYETTHFDTSAYASQNGLSIQMAARELRYRWFYKLAMQVKADAIAIAHNRDDRIETLLINLARGTSIQGLAGIRQQNEKIIRPLLFASRSDIEDYAREHIVGFREDSSNITDKYARNYIRHHVIPGLEEYFPGVRQNMERSMEHFSAIGMIYNEAIERYKDQVISHKDGLLYIDLKGLKQCPSPPTLLYEILKPFGFSNSVATKIFETQYVPGKQFFSNTSRLVFDRQSMIVQKLESEELRECLIDEHIRHIDNTTFRMMIEKFDLYPGFIPDTNPDSAFLDGDKLQYPLLLRKWNHGDKFRPLGMKNMKKLSDFFTNTKLSLVEKDRCKVLVSGGQIVWVVGMRIDDRYKITNKTKTIIKLTLEHSDN